MEPGIGDGVDVDCTDECIAKSTGGEISCGVDVVVTGWIGV